MLVEVDTDNDVIEETWAQFDCRIDESDLELTRDCIWLSECVDDLLGPVVLVEEEEEEKFEVLWEENSEL